MVTMNGVATVKLNNYKVNLVNLVLNSTCQATLSLGYNFQGNINGNATTSLVWRTRYILPLNVAKCYANVIKATSPIWAPILNLRGNCTLPNVSVSTALALSVQPIICAANIVVQAYSFILPYSPPFTTNTHSGTFHARGIRFEHPGGAKNNKFKPRTISAYDPPQPGTYTNFTDPNSVQFLVLGQLIDLGDTSKWKLISFSSSYDSGKQLVFEEIAYPGYGYPTFPMQSKVELYLSWGNGFYRMFTGVVRSRDHVGENNNQTIRYTALGYQNVANDQTVVDLRGVPELIFQSVISEQGVQPINTQEGNFNLPIVQFAPTTVFEAVIELFEIMGPVLAQNGISPYFDTTELSQSTSILPNEVRLTGGFVSCLQTLLNYAPGFKLFYNDHLQLWQFINVFNRPVFQAIIESSNIQNHTVKVSTEGRATAVMLIERPEQTQQKQKDHQSQTGDKTPKKNFVTVNLIPAWDQSKHDKYKQVTEGGEPLFNNGSPVMEPDLDDNGNVIKLSLQDDWTMENSVPNFLPAGVDPNRGVPIFKPDFVNHNPYEIVYRSWWLGEACPSSKDYPGMTAKLIHKKSQEIVQLPIFVDIFTYLTQGLPQEQTQNSLAEVEAICISDPYQELTNADIAQLIGTVTNGTYVNKGAYGVVLSGAPVIVEGNPHVPGDAVGPKYGEIALKLEWEDTNTPGQQTNNNQLPAWYRFPAVGFAGTAYTLGGIALERRYIVSKHQFNFKTAYLKWLAESCINITGSLSFAGDPCPELFYMGFTFQLISADQATPFPVPVAATGFTYQFGPAGMNTIEYTSDNGTFIKSTQN